MCHLLVWRGQNQNIKRGLLNMWEFCNLFGGRPKNNRFNNKPLHTWLLNYVVLDRHVLQVQRNRVSKDWSTLLWVRWGWRIAQVWLGKGGERGLSKWRELVQSGLVSLEASMKSDCLGRLDPNPGCIWKSCSAIWVCCERPKGTVSGFWARKQYDKNSIWGSLDRIRELEWFRKVSWKDSDQGGIRGWES